MRSIKYHNLQSKLFHRERSERFRFLCRKFQKDMVKYSCKNAKAGNVNLRCLKQRRFLHYNESAKEEFAMFQDNLKALRKKKGITQEELAARLNVVRQTVSKWEKGVSQTKRY